MDCAGPVLWAAAQLGIRLPDGPAYDPLDPDPAVVYRAFADAMDEQPLTDAGPGRVVLCRWTALAPVARHVVACGRSAIVHMVIRPAALADSRVIAQPRSWLARRAVAVFRLRGVDYGPPWPS